jgi:hypothetical protein
MARTGSDLLHRHATRGSARPTRSPGFDFDGALLAALASVAVAGSGLLIHFLSKMGTAVP